jgi:hypothetical protein
MGSETVNEDEAATTREAGEGRRTQGCPACGAVARRAAARFCSTCGRSLDEGYLPADGLRSSYHLGQRQPSRSRKPKGAPPEFQMTPSFSSTHGNATAHTALAFLTYSLVPYLGILFCPGAVVLGGIGLARSLRAPHGAGRRASYASIFVGMVVLCVQILLWWVIIKLPEWTRPL